MHEKAINISSLSLLFLQSFYKMNICILLIIKGIHIHLLQKNWKMLLIWSLKKKPKSYKAFQIYVIFKKRRRIDLFKNVLKLVAETRLKNAVLRSPPQSLCPLKQCPCGKGAGKFIISTSISSSESIALPILGLFCFIHAYHILIPFPVLFLECNSY